MSEHGFKVGDRVRKRAHPAAPIATVEHVYGDGRDYKYSIRFDERSGGWGFSQPVNDREIELAEPIDALGKPVPEWAKEAFAILSADGRRVAIERWPMEGGSRSCNSDAWIDVDQLGIWGVMTGGPRFSEKHDGTSAGAADAARRALAMEAERKGPKHGHCEAGAGGCDACDDEARADEKRHEQPRKHNAVCAHCGGPAYHGLFSATCLREGGCKTVEPIVLDFHQRGSGYDVAECLHRGERMWRLGGPGSRLGGDGRYYATRDLAIAAWREARREQERGK